MVGTEVSEVITVLAHVSRASPRPSARCRVIFIRNRINLSFKKYLITGILMSPVYTGCYLRSCNSISIPHMDHETGDNADSGRDDLTSVCLIVSGGHLHIQI